MHRIDNLGEPIKVCGTDGLAHALLVASSAFPLLKPLFTLGHPEAWDDFFKL